MKKSALAILILMCTANLGLAQQSFYDVTAGNGNGIRFWQSDGYKIHMGTGSEYQFGPVTDYSIKTNMDLSAAGRGWTWGVSGQTPVAAINTLGHMQIAGTFRLVTSSEMEFGVGITKEGNAGKIAYQKFSDALDVFGAGTSGSNRKIKFWAEGGATFTGNVGIGTTSPSGLLHVAGLNGNAWSYFAGNINGAGNPQNINGLALGWNKTGGAGESIITYNTSAGSNPRLDFASFNGTTFSTEMTLLGGKLAIGTNSPYQLSKLHIKAPGANPWGIMAEANSNDKVVALGHDGTSGVISVSYLSSAGWSPLLFRTQNVTRMTIGVDGNIGIGTASPIEKLTVNGTIYGKEVKVDLSVPGPDYVFDEDYKLTPLEEIKTYIDKNKHLPEVPSAKEMEKNGIQLGEMNMLLLKKIEELTLYLIELKTENDNQQKQNIVQQKEIEILKSKMK